MLLYYVELGESITSLITQMPEEIRLSPFIIKVIKEIDRRQKAYTEPTPEKSTEKLDLLTSREQEVLNLVADGLRNQEISDKLFLSQDTIKKHLYNMFQKMQVKNRLSLVTKAKEEGILVES
jgi:DNA-binding NarL/FixJ family response regulator